MANRTGTYVAFDGLGEADPTKSDFKYYATIQAWSANKNIEFSSDGHNTKVTENPLNENWKDFKKLWERINKRYAYTCEFDGAELIKKSIEVINIEPRVAKLPYTLTKGEQEGTDFNIEKTETKKLDRTQDSFADYDLIGEIAEGTTLTRRTATAILTDINKDKLWLFRANPEEFISKVVGIINKQKASIVVEHITYAPSAEEPCTQDVFNMSRASDEHTKAFSAKRSIPDFVFAGIYQRLVQAGIAHS